ncbi:polyamine-modulated factor 1 isoform X3 [Phascolarctos cinereus]
MANASGSNVGSSSAEVVGGEESSLAEGSSTAHIPKVKLLDTVVDTFLQKLVSAGRCVGGSQVLQWTELWTWSQEDPSSTNPASNTSWLCDTSYERFAKCYKRFYKLQPEMTRLIYDQFITQLQTSIREEVSTIKEEGNLEAVLNSLDKIVEEAEDRKEPAWLLAKNRESWQQCWKTQSEEASQLGPTLLILSRLLVSGFGEIHII